jgi:small subunit ribosomal protein S8
MTTDNLRIMFTCIRNAVRIEKETVEVPKTRITQIVANILLQNGIITELREIHTHRKKVNKHSLLIGLKYFGAHRIPAITNIQRISSSNRPIYTSFSKIPVVLGGFGIVLVSSSKGLMTDRDARYHIVGGEILCTLWSIFILLK